LKQPDFIDFGAHSSARVWPYSESVREMAQANAIAFFRISPQICTFSAKSSTLSFGQAYASLNIQGGDYAFSEHPVSRRFLG
jgi:hypothetical protein